MENTKKIQTYLLDNKTTMFLGNNRESVSCGTTPGTAHSDICAHGVKQVRTGKQCLKK